MPLIRPFRALRPLPHTVADVAAPPYDVLSSAEARRRVKDQPYSFLHVSKPEIDLREGVDPHDPQVYAKAAENLSRMREEGILVQDSAPGFYVYRMTMGDHVQTGLAAAASVAAYNENRIRKHEFTRPDKEDDRVRQIEATGAQTGPVLLAYRAEAEVDGQLARAAAGEPELDVMLDGVRHQLWPMTDSGAISRLSDFFDAMDAIYVADGHHRSAAAARVAAMRAQANPGHTGKEAYNYFLTVIFSHRQMKIFDYNRIVRDLNGLDEDVFLARIAQAFQIEAKAAEVRPARAGEFGMYLPGRWFRLKLRTDVMAHDDPVAQLDVSLLASHLIEPVLGIDDPRRDPRIDFVGGIRGLKELERRVDSGEMAVAFSLFPTSMEALMAVADSGKVMPPKSTWFEPKLADGLASHLLDEPQPLQG
ncbi:MAG: DUF1015 family protein [Mariprofundaceae bacterium]